MKLYRIENRKAGEGLWYRSDGTYGGVITKLSNALCRDLPMEFDPQFRLGGVGWLSACDSLPDLKNWFGRDDVIELSKLGYGLFEFNVPYYRTLNGHAVFNRATVTSFQKLSMETLL